MRKVPAPVVFIILDAFRWDYVNPADTPFLWELAGKGVYAEQLVSSSGFTQRSAIFTGAPADVHDSYTMFCYGPEESPWKPLKPLSGFLRAVESTPWYGSEPIEFAERQFRHRVLYRLARREAAHPPSAHIPLHILPLISVTEDKHPIYSNGALGVESIFDILRSEGRSYCYLMFPDVSGDDNLVLEIALKAASDHHDFYLLQFSDSDSGCHHHGTSSLARREIAREMDRKVRAVYEAYSNIHPETQLFVIGDHGMMDVSERIDVAGVVHSRAKSACLVHGRDYLLFLDSTLARMWYFSDRARQLLEPVWSEGRFESLGGILTPARARACRIPPPCQRYGETIWMANPGVLIWPDYFHASGQQVLGMHGYSSHHPDMKGFALLYSPSCRPRHIEEVELLDVCPTLCDLLGIRYPESNEGESMVGDEVAGVVAGMG